MGLALIVPTGRPCVTKPLGHGQFDGEQFDLADAHRGDIGGSGGREPAEAKAGSVAWKAAPRETIGE